MLCASELRYKKWKQKRLAPALHLLIDLLILLSFRLKLLLHVFEQVDDLPEIVCTIVCQGFKLAKPIQFSHFWRTDAIHQPMLWAFGGVTFVTGYCFGAASLAAAPSRYATESTAIRFISSHFVTLTLKSLDKLPQIIPKACSPLQPRA